MKTGDLICIKDTANSRCGLLVRETGWRDVLEHRIKARKAWWVHFPDRDEVKVYGEKFNNFYYRRWTMERYKVEQIYYSNWSQELKEGHEDYWNTISLIAMWIGNSLEASRRSSGLKTLWNSTIGVTQTKEKFGQVRVYCYFAIEKAVSKEYKRLRKSIAKQNQDYYKWLNTGKPASWGKKDYTSGKYPIKIPDLIEFTRECYFKDLKYYRKVYFDAFKLWPQYEKAIREGADLREYLFETPDGLDHHFDTLIKNQLSWLKNTPHWSSEGEKNIINNLTKRKEEIKKYIYFSR